jgi:hypothetical protein
MSEFCCSTCSKFYRLAVARFGPTFHFPRQACVTVRSGVRRPIPIGGDPANLGLDEKLYDAAPQLDPLDRDGRMLDSVARDSFEFCFCGKQSDQTTPEQGSAKHTGSMIRFPIAQTAIFRWRRFPEFAQGIRRNFRGAVACLLLPANSTKAQASRVQLVIGRPS